MTDKTDASLGCLLGWAIGVTILAFIAWRIFDNPLLALFLWAAGMVILYVAIQSTAEEDQQ